MTFPVDSLVAVTTWKRLYRRYSRFLRTVESEYSQHSGSGKTSSNGSDTDVPGVTAQGNGREALLYNLLDMPGGGGGYADSSSCSCWDRCSYWLLPCFKTSTRSIVAESPVPSGGSNPRLYGPVPTSDNPSHHSEPVEIYSAAEREKEDPERYPPLYPDRVSSVSGNISMKQDIFHSKSAPAPISPIFQQVLDHSGNNTAGGMGKSPRKPFPSSVGVPGSVLDDNDIDYEYKTSFAGSDGRGSGGGGGLIGDIKTIQAQIQSELTNNHIRGSTSRSNLSSISSNSRRPSSSTLSTHSGIGIGKTSFSHPHSRTQEMGSDAREEQEEEERNRNDLGVIRRSSLGNVLYEPRSFRTMLSDMVPAAFIWGVCIVACIYIKKWVIVAGAIGMFSSALLSFLFPSMIYFRVGVRSDYQAVPILCNTVIPNRLYMLCIQLIGLICVAAVIGLILLASIRPEEVNNYGYSDDIRE